MSLPVLVPMPPENRLPLPMPTFTSDDPFVVDQVRSIEAAATEGALTAPGASESYAPFFQTSAGRIVIGASVLLVLGVGAHIVLRRMRGSR